MYSVYVCAKSPSQDLGEPGVSFRRGSPSFRASV